MAITVRWYTDATLWKAALAEDSYTSDGWPECSTCGQRHNPAISRDLDGLARGKHSPPVDPHPPYSNAKPFESFE